VSGDETSGGAGDGLPSDVRKEAVAMANGTTEKDFRELAYRASEGLEVTLLWSARENRLAVTVRDSRSGEQFALDAQDDNALEVFYHPYAHAALQAAA
jgi:hypothetical protein